MTEVSLFDICEQLLSEKPKIRIDGLRNLKFILNNCRKMQFVGEKCYQRLLECLIKAVACEKHSTIQKGKLNNITRLQEYGVALRSVIELGNKFLKVKTFSLVLNHIIDTLSIAEETLCQALGIDYIKCLKLILSYPPHVEHLGVNEWEKLVLFCSSFIINLEDSFSFPNKNVSSSDIELLEEYRQPLKHLQRMKHESIELMYCLQVLVSWSSAPIGDCLFNLVDFLLNFLSYYNSETNAHLFAFTALNSVIQKIMINNFEFLFRVAHTMIKLCVKLWNTKSFLLKNQLIIGLILAYPHWYRGFNELCRNVLETDLINLFRCIQSDYINLQDKEMLSINDITLHSPILKGNVGSFFCFSSSLRCLDLSLTSKKSEQYFFILQIAASIIHIFESKESHFLKYICKNDNDESLKEHQVLSFFEKFGYDVCRSSNSTKMFWLQIMVFFFERAEACFCDDFSTILRHFINLLSDNDVIVQTWALLGIGSFVSWKKSYHHTNCLIPDVLVNTDILQLCLRKSAIPITCRSACHVLSLFLDLDLVDTSMMLSVFRHVFDSIEINGPAIISSDSYRFLLLLLFRLEQNNCLVGIDGSLCLLQWFLSRWNSLDFLKGSNIYYFSNFPVHVEFLISCCLNSGFVIKNRQNCQFGSIGLFSLRQNFFKNALLYFLVQKLNISDEEDLYDEFEVLRNKIVLESKFIVLERVMFIILSIQNTVKIVHSRWTELLKESTHINIDVFRSFVQFSFIVILFTYFILGIDKNMDEFTEISLNLLKEITKFLASESCSRDQIDIVLYCLNGIFCLSFKVPFTEESFRFNETSLNLFRQEIYALLQILKQRSSFFQLQDSSRVIMDDDDDRPLIIYQENIEKYIPFLRNYIDAKYSVNSIKATVLLYLEFVLLGSESLDIFNMSGFHLQKSVLFILFKNQIGDNLIQLGFFLISYLLSSVDKMTEDDISEILENFAKTYLTQYEFERSDVILMVSTDLLRVIVKKWLASENNSSLRKVFGKILEWILKITLENCLASFYARIQVLKLLNSIYNISKDYGLSLKSLNIAPNEIFLRLLKDRDLGILYSAVMLIKFIFQEYDPIEHSRVYFDIISQLEIKEEKFEKIALRALFLSNILVVSEYVRKAAFYNLIELGKLDSIALFVLKCLQWSCKILSLKSELSLFNAYRSQVIWSWLDFEGKLDNFPFKVLNFSSNINFYSLNFDEIIPQLILFGKNEYLVEISNLIQVSLKKGIRDAFHKIVGYVLLSYNEKNMDSTLILDSFCKNYLDNEEFMYLLRSKFPMILSVLFGSMKDEMLISKIFCQFDLKNEAINFDEISDFGISDNFLPEPSRPFYKVECILKSIWDLCKYSDMPVYKLNDVYIIVYIFRYLMLHCQLGTSLSEKCLQLRKFRVFMCLLDRNLIHGYILKVLLQGLLEYLCFPECFIDVSGMLRYLLMCGYRCHDFSTIQSTVFLNVIMSLIRYGAINIKSNYFNSIIINRLFVWIIEYCDLIAKIQELSSISFFLKSYYKVIICSEEFLSTKSQNIITLSESLLNNVEFFDQNSALILLEVLQKDSRVLLFESDEFISIKKILFSICDMSKISLSLLHYGARVLGQWYVRNKIINKAIYFELMNKEELSSFKLRTSKDPRFDILSTVFSLLNKSDHTILIIVEKTLRNIFKKISLEMFDELVGYKYRDIATIYISNMFALEKNQSLEHFFEEFNEYYWKDKTILFSDWLKFLLLTILYNFNDDFVFGCLGDLVEHVTGFSEKIFIFSVDYLLLNKDIGESINIIKVLNKIVNFVFSQYEDTFYRPHICLMIEMILYLRSQPSEIHYSGFDLNFRLEINYFNAALAAASCQFWETSLLFICIHWTANDSIIDDEMLKLLSVVYKKINDPDSFYGIPYAVSLENILSRHKFEGNGWKSLFLHGAALENDYRMSSSMTKNEHVLGVMEAFDMLGFRSFSRMNFSYFRNNVTVGFLKDQYSSSWRLEQWDLPCAPLSSSLDHVIYNILQLVNKDVEQNIFFNILDIGYSMMVDFEKYPVLSDKRTTGLIMLTEIEEIFSCSSFSDLWFRWESRLSVSNPCIKFTSIEPILSLRQVLLSSILKNSSFIKYSVDKPLIRNCLIKTLVELSQVARINDNLQIAFSAITYAEKLLKLDLKVNSELLSPVVIEISRVLWDQGDRINSVRLLREMVNDKDIDLSEKHEISPELFAQLASWTSVLRLERPDFIMEKYFKYAVRLLGDKKYGNEAGYVFHEFGFFCDKQLELLNNHDDFERIRKLRKQKSEELAVLDQMISNASVYDKKTLLLHRDKAKALFDIDDIEFNRLIENKEIYLQKSIKNYLRSLISCDNYDHNISRCMSLWLSNVENDTVNQTVRKLIYNIPTHKFLRLFTQLASRLSENKSHFQSILHELIKHICVDHPYHSLFYLVSLRHTVNKDDKSGLLRKRAVDAVLSKLLLPSALGDMLRQFMNLCSAYADFAIYKMKKKEYGTRKISFSVYPKFNVFLEDIPKYRLPPPTMDISIRSDCNYDDVPVISHYSPYFMLASGISLPKVIECVSSDGQLYKQLVKGGNDDLRQDAIMEQVFQQVHAFLQKNRLTRQRNLGIRTYKVLPLTKNAGILEWVLYTFPIQDYLHPAHEKYNPKDWTPDQCRKAIDCVSKKSKEIRFQTFNRVVSHFKPVMRHFFMDHFSDPKDWFQKQLNYTRSTAVISMLGYVLGLGDRHGHNILIDKTTGEVVHIDLGVAFDQGKLLPIPETVPFRLTRDIVDGMGIIRTEGVFRRCCEFTLNVLREEAFNIISILETLKYDPLYSWTISPLRIKKMQENETLVNNIDNDFNNVKENSIDGTEAERALLIVSQKLSKTLSVEAVVNELLHEATNPNNLALLFYGWAAYF
ncbi:hypothetical protein MERGE_001109 [Pneumocystis wakefieldiae]|uniref:Serine/threonine-protein kinase Tel1 n=1 Tax=Pneumocystis wakefieldiae TaxID=38082 RepID=A0A899G1T0_9ASCO|nr:hypothetical protein MERGE_001109 [Pneumocystis wakefieldiae]